jgi:hypothetical protein
MSASRQSPRATRNNAFEGPSENYVAPPLYVWLIVLLLIAVAGATIVGLVLLKQISLSLLAGLPVDPALAQLRG